MVSFGFTQYGVLLVGTYFHDCCCYKHTTLTTMYCGIIILLHENIFTLRYRQAQVLQQSEPDQLNKQCLIHCGFTLL